MNTTRFESEEVPMTDEEPAGPLYSVRRRLWKWLGRAPIWQKMAGLVLVPMTAAFIVGMLANDQPSSSFGWVWVTGVLVVGFGLAAGMGFALTRPLYTLRQAIDRLHDGEMDARVPIWANDEVGDVQKSFNRLADELERSTDESLRSQTDLAFLNDLAGSAALARSVEGTIEVVLKGLVEVLSLDAVAVFLPQEQDQLKRYVVVSPERRTGMASSGVSEEPASDNHVNRVLASGLPVEPSAARPEELLIGDLMADRALVASYCTPIPATPHTLGVLAVARCDGPGLGDSERTLVSGAARIAGVNILTAQLLESREQGERELRGALGKCVTVQEDERRRLSRELHDETGQSLTSMLIHLKALQDETDVEVIHDRLNGLRLLASQTLAEVRRLSRDLRPAALDDLGLVAAIRGLIDGTNGDDDDLEVRFDVGELPETIDADIELALYRCAQEALTNVRRHARASRAVVAVGRSNQRVWLTVSDDGIGLDSLGDESGLGLIGMRERVGALGGRLSVESAEGHGTRVLVELAIDGGSG